MKLYTVALLFIIGLMTGCATTDIYTYEVRVDMSSPTYEYRVDQFLLGTIGYDYADVNYGCNGAEIEHLQIKKTPLQVFLMLITYGIYTPQYVYVWCDSHPE